MKKLSAILALALAISLNILTPSEAQAPLHQTPIQVKELAKSYAEQQLKFRGYRSPNWDCLNDLWEKESHWNYLADNKQSTAFGIAQVLGEDSKDYVTQIDNG